MRNKILFTSLFLSSLYINSCFAAFDYSGSFNANRQSNEAQSYYILLNENTKISFSIKSEGKISKDIFVNSIKLSSDEKCFLSSKTGINSYVVPSTGIYEVSVTTILPLNKSISYDLTVSEINEKTDISNVKEETNNEVVTAQSSTNIGEATIKDNSDKVESISDTKKIENQISESNSINSNENQVSNIINTPKNETQTENKSIEETKSIEEKIDSNADINDENNNNDNNDIQTAVAEPLGPETEALEISPDTVAIEDNQNIPYNQIKVQNQKLVYNGNLKLIKSIDVYKFIADKNKCWPKAICFDNYENLWILDGQLNKISCYDLNGREIISFGTKGKSKNEFGIPVSLAIFNNNILVGDRQKNCIHIFNREGNWVNVIQNDPNVGLKITNPVSICIRNNEEIWVGDGSSKRILCFDKNYSFLGSFGSSNDSKIESFSSVSNDNEFIYILEDNGILKKFGTMGNLISALPTDYNYSSGLYVDKNRNSWIIESEQGKIICLSPEDGKIHYLIDETLILKLLPNNKRFSPTAISISPSSKIAIADSYSKQVYIFEIK